MTPLGKARILQAAASVPCSTVCLVLMGMAVMVSHADELPSSLFTEITQSSDDPSDLYPAEQAADDNTSSFSLTDDVANSYWQAELGRPYELERIEIVNRESPADAEMAGLTLSLFNIDDQVVHETVLSNPGSGETSVINLPVGTTARMLRIGLSGSEVNGAGNQRVGLAEVRLFGTPDIPYTPTPDVVDPTANLASSKRTFMLRISDADEPSSNVNDGDYGTEARTSANAFDGYWEVDLGATYALYGIRAVVPSDLAERIPYTIVRLFDEEHDSVHYQKVTGSGDVFDIDLNGPHFARYVRIGLEDKTRPNETGTANRYEIGFNEVEVFGRPASEVGVLSFNTSDTSVSSGQNVTLDWSLEDVNRVEIYPAIGSVGAETATNGLGSISQTVTSSTEFMMVGSNSAGTFTKAVGVEVDGVPLSVQISEVVADNKYSLRDGYDDSPDWIELRNTGNNPVDLTGWGLSDDPSDLMQWVFPATIMAPHSTLIVFASKEEPSLDPAGYLHADFKLSADGDSVYLTQSDGTTVVDNLVGFPALDRDLSYARDLEGLWTFMEPTPNAVNMGEKYSGWLEPLVWSHNRGFHDTAFTLTVTSENPGATILYSLDGSEPSIPYESGISISGTSAVRIQPVQAGYKSPSIQTKTFVFLDDVINSPQMDTAITQDPEYADRIMPGLLAIPAISLVVPTTPDYPEQMCSMEILWTDGQNPIQENCGISLYGGAVQTFAKDSFKLSFRSEYGEGKLNAPLFDGFDQGIQAATSFDRLLLSAGNQDRSTGFYMSDRFVQDSLLNMGSLNPHGRYVHVYLNGEYWGQYNCKESLDESFMEEYLGGSKEDYVEVKGNRNERTGLGWSIGVGKPPTPEPWERVRALRDNYEAVKPYLDTSHFIDFMLLWGYGQCEQEFKACGPIEAGSGHKFVMNDSDRFLRDSSNDRLNNTIGPGWLWHDLLGEDHPDFKTLMADRIYRNYFNNGAMTPAACDARLVARMDEIRDSFLLEAARWGYVSPATWETKGQAIRDNLFPFRSDELIAQWRGHGWFPAFDPPLLNQLGGQVTEGFGVTLTSPVGIQYYTLDGSDPRLPGGGVSSSAIIYSSASTTEEVLIPVGSDWNYLDDGSDQGTAWRGNGFNDAMWSSGAAELGYGDDQVTELGYGGDDDNKFTTSYFRHTFDAADVSEYVSLELRLLRDDGAVVYLNGVELFRDNMNDGAVTYTTFAKSGVGGAAESTFYPFILPGNLLAEGGNVLAVEIHQDDLGSSDISFNLELKGVRQLGGTTGEPVILTENATIQSRVLHDGEWSALSEALFFVGDPIAASAANLVVTELNYNPPGSEELTEFVELMNIDPTNSIDLSGVTLTGVTYSFAAGTYLAPLERILVVRDQIAFAAAYNTTGLNIAAGDFAGTALNNGGEEIGVITGDGSADIRRFTYSDDFPWPSAPDGDGFTLTLIGPETNPDHSDPSNWRSSTTTGGNPGSSDAATPFLGDPDFDSDLDGLSDFMEYALGTNASIPDLADGFAAGISSFDNGSGTLVEYLTVAYRRNLAADDVIYEAQVSEDLSIWDPQLTVLVSVTNNFDGTETHVYRSTSPRESLPRQFIRLQVEKR
ncbi:lamin tail domain-containing protein [Haloferula sp.]|uniref:lamin tail domain-containing protein n=1 Tax=Haloferula sp. TaxID=2497595 RepID=UPI00329B1479